MPHQPDLSGAQTLMSVPVYVHVLRRSSPRWKKASRSDPVGCGLSRYRVKLAGMHCHGSTVAVIVCVEMMTLLVIVVGSAETAAVALMRRKLVFILTTLERRGAGKIPKHRASSDKMETADPRIYRY